MKFSFTRSAVPVREKQRSAFFRADQLPASGAPPLPVSGRLAALRSAKRRLATGTAAIFDCGKVPCALGLRLHANLPAEWGLRRRFLAGALVFREKAERDESEPEYRHAEQDGDVLMEMFLLCRTICRDEKDGKAAGEQADGTKNADRQK
ncbi:MAG: hypothetical protein DBX51_04780 [Clostridiales bacterium]|nr:MAG: hypothetical protein DBX51_04780 [Clostridiales bacterium]